MAAIGVQSNLKGTKVTKTLTEIFGNETYLGHECTDRSLSECGPNGRNGLSGPSGF